ncbi:MAG: hypothetical protein BWY82_01010 [Verrucomicrobia bacterium ADurb.Bin474]|nr:MAG: hypothetical protein BWY82_01010 [Verrucomicrobia bacterium ADurb.Bin474]
MQRTMRRHLHAIDFECLEDRGQKRYKGETEDRIHPDPSRPNVLDDRLFLPFQGQRISESHVDRGHTLTVLDHIADTGVEFRPEREYAGFQRTGR